MQTQFYRWLKREERVRQASPPIPNLGMILSTKWNVGINLRSMVRPIPMITLG